MKLLSLNVNMSNYDIDDSFFKYLEEVSPDIAMLQEFRYNRYNDKKEIYKIILPKKFENSKTVDSRFHLTIALCKDENTKEIEAETKDSKYDYKYLIVEKDYLKINGIHLPLVIDKDKDEFEKLCNVIKASKATIICGDFNASNKSNSLNDVFLNRLKIDEEYIDLWQNGIDSGKAYYINYKGEEIKADGSKYYRTYSGNTHIDYILAKKASVTLEKITIDSRTLAFTDHCAVIAEFQT